MVNVTELDKRIIMYTTWKTDSTYEIKLVMNETTKKQLAVSVGKQDIDEYKSIAINIDNDLADEDVLIISEKIQEEGE